MFPRAYQQMMETGKEVREFLEEHPDGVLDCNIVVLQRSECGALESAPDLPMFIPEEDLPDQSSGSYWSGTFH